MSVRSRLAARILNDGVPVVLRPSRPPNIVGIPIKCSCGEQGDDSHFGPEKIGHCQTEVLRPMQLVILCRPLLIARGLNPRPIFRGLVDLFLCRALLTKLCFNLTQRLIAHDSPSCSLLAAHVPALEERLPRLLLPFS